MTTRKRTTAKAKQQVSETQTAADATAPTSAPVPEAAPAVDESHPAPPVEPEAVPPAEKPEGMIKGYGAGIPEHAVIEAKAAAERTTPTSAPLPEAAAPADKPGDTIIGDGTGKALPPIDTKELPGLFVRTKRRIKSRRRAGYRFNREGTGIALELLNAEQIRQLRDDPALEVEDCTFPIADAVSEPEA
ncbi:hypothetical protein [Vreelandella sp. EE27]